MTTKSFLPALCFAAAATFGATASAQVVLTHHGRLLTGADEPVSGTPRLTVSLYESKDATTPLWQTTRTVTVDPTGSYSILLGEPPDEPLTPAAATGAQYLGVSVDDTELSPRLRLGSVPVSEFARTATVADMALSLHADATVEALQINGKVAHALVADSLAGGSNGALPESVTIAGSQVVGAVAEAVSANSAIIADAPSEHFQLPADAITGPLSADFAKAPTADFKLPFSQLVGPVAADSFGGLAPTDFLRSDHVFDYASPPNLISDTRYFNALNVAAADLTANRDYLPWQYRKNDTGTAKFTVLTPPLRTPSKRSARATSGS